MPHLANTKALILLNAKEIALEQGLSELHVRTVAQRMGIALGTIYNYYPTKGALIADIVEDFWMNAFFNIDFAAFMQLDTISALREMYDRLFHYVNSFKENWLEQLTMLHASDKAIGREKEKEYMQKVQSFILLSLENNPVFLEEFAQEERVRVAAWVFGTMLNLLKKGEQDFQLFEKVLGKMLA